MKFDCTGVILAGGKNSRFPGMKKAFRKVGDAVILETIQNVFSTLFNEVILVVNDPVDFAGWDMTIVTDIDRSKCALSGLHAGLFYASNPHVFVTACDTPFVNPDIIKHLIAQIDPKIDVVIPRTDDGLEPLSAVYSKTCIPLIEKKLSERIYMIKKFFRPRKVKEVAPEVLKTIDPDMSFFFNVNTAEDLETATRMSDNTKEEI